jgi:hypothetical protein
VDQFEQDAVHFAWVHEGELAVVGLGILSSSMIAVCMSNE